MPDGVSRGGPERLRPSDPPPEAAKTPVEDPAVEQAASEFSSLMDGENRKAGDGKEPKPSEGKKSKAKGEKKPGSQQTTDDKSPGTTSRRTEKRGDEGSKQKQGDSGRDGERQSYSPGDAILQSLAKQEVGDAGTPVQASAGGPPETSQTMEKIAQQVASQVLVSDPASGGREVRITLKDSILPGTEVRIAENAGKLEVQFLTNSRDSQTTLAENQMALQQRLTDKLGQRDVAVSVEFDSQRQGEQQDGRSRQQRSVVDEIDADDDA